MGLKPVKGFTLYIQDDTKGDGDKHYLETYSLKISDDRSHYMAKDIRPASMEDLKAMTKCYMSADKGIGLVLDTFTVKVIKANWMDLIKTSLTKDSLEMVWYSKPGIRKIYFQKGLSIKTGDYHMPGMIWKYNRNSLYVFAVKGEPTAESKLFCGPFMNTDEKGKICLGSTKMKFGNQNNLDDVANMIETAFFKSEFTHGGNGTVSGIEDAYAESKKSYFPLDKLISVNLTLKELCTK